MLACSTEVHEAAKRVEAWWRDQPLIGFTLLPFGVLEQRNCGACHSTVCRYHRGGTEMTMQDEAPDGYWISARGYARLATELEGEGHPGVADHYFARAHDAAVASFEEACAAAADAVPHAFDDQAEAGR